MKTKDEIIAILQNFKEEFGKRYGIEKLGLFGSVARGEQKEDSDIDISSMKSKTATIFVSGNECLFLSTSFFLALLHGGSVPIIVGTMNNYVNFLFEIKTQPGVLLRPKR